MFMGLFIFQDTFVRAKSWVKELQRQASPNIVIALSGNKADLASKRMVDFEVGFIKIFICSIHVCTCRWPCLLHSLHRYTRADSGDDFPYVNLGLVVKINLAASIVCNSQIWIWKLIIRGAWWVISLKISWNMAVFPSCCRVCLGMHWSCFGAYHIGD